MPFYELKDIQEIPLANGITIKAVYGSSVSVSFLEFPAYSTIPPHTSQRADRDRDRRGAPLHDQWGEQVDEPTAALSDREKSALFERIRRLQERGPTILYISHRMEEIFEISDRITVLRDGQLMQTLNRSETNQDEIVRLMIGRSLKEFLHVREERQRGDKPLLEVRDFSRAGLFENVSFTLYEREILGFAGTGGGAAD